MHRNINPDIFYFNKSLCKIYMFDFGSCCTIKDSRQKIVTNLIFSSPEIIENTDSLGIDSSGYTIKSLTKRF